MPPSVTVIPTLARMAAVYALPRDGGAASPRFAAYRAMAHEWGMSGWNPMAGDHAAASVAALLALDAEQVVHEAAVEAAAALGVAMPIVLAVTLMSPGMWTDRLASEVERTVAPRRVAGHGVVVMWSREPLTADALVRVTRAEVARVAWAAHHGEARTIVQVLEREGLARAIGDPSSADDAESWGNVAFVVRASPAAQGLPAVAPVAFGDAVAEQLGWTPAGLPPEAGLRWAGTLARAAIAARGAPAVVRETGWLLSAAGT